VESLLAPSVHLADPSAEEVAFEAREEINAFERQGINTQECI
jgi:hypothetical protein